nr:NlpC/P60 family protein [Vibrio furnissii]
MMRKRIPFLVVCLALAGCSSVPPDHHASESLAAPSSQSNTMSDNSLEARKEIAFFDIYNQWQGVPYQFGGNTKRGVDCSAFVQIAYRDAWQQPLPRTTTSQSQVGNAVAYNQAKYGDLVFFKTSRSTQHVGVYLGNKLFMHASTSQGVMISRLDNPYWASKFWQFRRIETPPEIH